MDFFSQPQADSVEKPEDSHLFRWLDDISDFRERARRKKVFQAGYFSAVDYRSNYKTRNRYLLFEPDLRYEKWLSHGAIPHCFRPFICNLAYVGRPELALYVRLILLVDQFGICYDTRENIAKGVVDHPRRIRSSMDALRDRHLIMCSDEEVYIPWIAAEKQRTREIFQRPKAAYTLARLHYLGFPRKVSSTAKKKVQAPSDRLYLDVETFDQCVDLLLKGYLTQEGPTVERPEGVSLLDMKRWMLERFMTPEQRRAIDVDDQVNNTAAARQMPTTAVKKSRPKKSLNPGQG